MKDLGYLQKYDAYGALLTAAQREICKLYYLYDLTLSEIAEEKGISKQAVSDSLKTSRQLFDFYEAKLAFVRRTEGAKAALEGFALRHPEFSEEIAAIADMVSPENA